ncbi:MAG: hypothetical protein J1E63_06800, partial [Muribaculaceae bacterium]|nr:hypothetical protein [Muribaculaceae bacterium]
YYKYTAAGTIGNYIPARYMMDNIADANTALADVLANAGTVNRDKVERRVAADAAAGTATFGGAALGNGIIDTERDAEGFFDYAPATAKVDTDGDGMPDEWEKANGLNPAVADNNILNSEGYTALEVYLNSLMGELSLTDFGSGVELTLAPAEATFDAASRAIIVAPATIGGRVEVYTTDGRLVASRAITSTTIALGDLNGTMLVRISSPATTPAVLKVTL